ncbi:nuclear pore complex protein Nup85-like [Ostrea edulis]|uniref:nuclear pore complex protein Nup85-like n=1 Tax=Ostrea edulis TaxID=37623 RepID=UPI002095AADC|nr:nuclear pore complex protein Nup85-like [Ostrea edulis]
MAEREREIQTCLISDSSCQYGLQSVWGTGNQLFVFPGRNPVLYSERRPATGKREVIQEVQWDIDLHHPVLRKMVNDSHNIFVTLQRKATQLNGAALHEQILKSSRHYRATQKAYLKDLDEMIESTRDEDQRQQYTDQMKLLDMSELIWSLCEILFIESPVGDLVIPQLLEWLKIHFTMAERMFGELVREEQPEHKSTYWATIFRLVLQGQVERAWRLLSLHSASQTEDFQTLISLLKRMPLLTHLYRGSSVTEFDMKWRHWRDDCQRNYEEQKFSINANLETVVRILCGEDAVFSELKEFCDPWYHMLISKALYQDPTIKACDLHYYVQGCQDEYRNSTRLGELDNILLSAIESDVYQVIKDSRTVFSNGWFVAHLTDLLQHCGQLEAYKLQFGADLREFLLLEYASSLMSHESLWIVGVSYLDHCAEFGRKYLELFLDRIPVNSEKKANKVLKICEDRKMTEQAKSICKVMGMRCIKNKRLGAALTWFLRSKDVGFATVLAEKFLLEYSESGEFTNLDLIDHLGPSMLLSNRLTFLGKYREFHKLYSEGDYLAAAELLLALLQARLAPKQFWITLLIDALPLLERMELIFNSQQTYELMQCLEELTTEYRLEKKTDILGFTEARKEQLDVLKLALTKNLAKAILQEGTVKVV